MTKKHYIEIAAILEDAGDLDPWQDPAEKLAVDRVARKLADYFGEENERFDRARFLEAAGVPS